MIDDLYKVTKHEYNSFIQELKPECIHKERHYGQDITIIDHWSLDRKRHFASCCVTDKHEDGELKTEYYIIDFPLPEERRAARVVRQITINDKDDAIKFLELLNELRAKGEDDD